MRNFRITVLTDVQETRIRPSKIILLVPFMSLYQHLGNAITV